MRNFNFGDHTPAFQQRAGFGAYPPAAGPSTAASGDGFDRAVAFLFSPSGRVSRRAYCLSSLVFSLINLCVLYILLAPWVALLTGALTPVSPDGAGYLLAQYTTLFMTSLLVFWCSLVITIKRWHDLGKSGAWMLIVFVPIIGPLWQWVMCGLVAGTPGVNRYGTPQ